MIRHIRIAHAAENRDTMLRNIERKYKNGIPSTSTNFGNNENDIIKSEPLDLDEDYRDNQQGIDEYTPVPSPTEEDLKQFEQDNNEEEEGEGGTGAHCCNHCGKMFKNAKSLNTHKW